jgi:transcriptional regulator with GAF, ATPase, and Fis domain
LKLLPRSLKNTLLFAVALLVTATGLSISHLVIHRYSASLLDGAAVRAESIARKMALDVVDEVLVNDLVGLQKILEDQMASEPSVAYLFVMRDGKVLTHTFTDGIPIQLIGANADSPGENGRIEKILSQEGDRYLDVAYPILDGRAGVLRMGLAKAPYQSQIRRMRIQMSGITLLILLLSLVVVHWVIVRLTKPLHDLAACAGQIDAGNLNPLDVAGGKQEVAKVAAAFNSMLVRVKDHTLQLKQANEELVRTNQELDRTYMQLKTSFSVSQNIGALSKLDQICSYLIQTLKGVCACRDMYLLVFSRASRTANLATPFQTHHLDSESYQRLVDLIGPHEQLAFIRPPESSHLSSTLRVLNTEKIALFPIRHHGETIGAMMVACSPDCRCVGRESAFVSMMMQQSSGAIHRANGYEEELRELRQRIDVHSGFGGIIGKDPKMQSLFKLIEDVAPTDATVLIQGESGTGKELVARAIHLRSTRSENPFVVINCTAYPSTLLESELFGHEKGAFTGAVRRKIGRFEQADGGTVFLDEIGEIEPGAQSKLLRVLQQQTIDRLGGDSPIKLDVRILAATNKKLLDEVRKGNFREDLFYRLNVIPIHLPPLRERKQDIHLLVRYFVERFAGDQGKKIVGVRSDAMRVLLDSPWPGNIRELENSIEHAVILAKGDHIDLKDLPSAMSTCSFDLHTGGDKMAESENRLIREVLDSCNWNKKKAAAQLGISRSTLYGKIKRFKIDNTH